MCSGRLFVRPRTPGSVNVNLEAELRRDHRLLANRSESVSDEFFVYKRPVRFRRVEESDSTLKGTPQQRDHLPSIARRVVDAGHAHATQPTSRDL
jgi:hypothetical protein